jgi:hypothetical protein
VIAKAGVESVELAGLGRVRADLEQADFVFAHWPGRGRLGETVARHDCCDQAREVDQLRTAHHLFPLAKNLSREIDWATATNMAEYGPKGDSRIMAPDAKMPRVMLAAFRSNSLVISWLKNSIVARIGALSLRCCWR